MHRTKNDNNTSEVTSSSSSKRNILDTVKLDKALRVAKKMSKEGQIEAAKNIYEDVLQKFAKNKTALMGL